MDAESIWSEPCGHNPEGLCPQVVSGIQTSNNQPVSRGSGSTDFSVRGGAYLAAFSDFLTRGPEQLASVLNCNENQTGIARSPQRPVVTIVSTALLKESTGSASI